MEIKKTKLRPIVYNSSYFKSGYQNTTQQMFLLKALQVTQDPKKLKEMIGVKTVAEVYRTLDKLAMRKEYHEALARKGISFDYIVSGIKDIADNGYKDGDKLKAFQTLLKSVGMEKYDSESIGTTGTWEEVLLKKIEEGKATGSVVKPQLEQYNVTQPVVPESVKQIQKDEEELTSSIYETDPKKL